MKILVIRLSSIGDVILTSFAVRLLRNKFPDAQIDFLVAKDFASLVQYNPRINNVLTYDKSKPFISHIFETLSIHNPNHYDIIIDLHNNLRSRVYTLGKGSAIYRFDKRRLYKLSLVWFKKRRREFQPIPILYKNTMPELCEIDDGLGLELWLPEEREFYPPFTKKSDSNLCKRIIFSPFAKHETKSLTLEIASKLLKELLDETDYEVVLLGSKDDALKCKKLEISKRIVNICGETDLLEATRVVDSSDLVVSVDSSIVHIASARKVKVVVIYGSTVPEFGFVPFRVPYKIIENNDLNCRPCTHFGRSRCPKTHFRCMNGIDHEAIINAIRQF